MNLRNLFILLAMIWLTSTAYTAEDSEHKNVPEIEQQQNKQSKTNSKISTGKRARVQTLEEFIPSEEVSADKPVAFPSDI